MNLPSPMTEFINLNFGDDMITDIKQFSDACGLIYYSVEIKNLEKTRRLVFDAKGNFRKEEFIYKREQSPDKID